jgi:hypothetical protein
MHQKIFGSRHFDTTERSHLQSVEIFKKNFSCRLRYEKYIVSKQREPYTQRRSTISHTPSQRNPKTLKILLNFDLFSTKKILDIKQKKITGHKPEILNWNEANTQTGLVSGVQTYRLTRNKRFATAMARTALFQCKAQGGAGRGREKPPECQSPSVSKRQIAQP